jgi:hypothetical protein
MNLEQIKNKWNSEADEYNKWDSLGLDEQVEYAYLLGELKASLSSTKTYKEGLREGYEEAAEIAYDWTINYVVEDTAPSRCCDAIRREAEKEKI